MARRNRFALPCQNEAELAQLYQFRDFEHFLNLWMMTTPAIQTETDFRQVVVSYGEQAASQGAVYIEGIFTPAERVSGGASWDLKSSRDSAMGLLKPTSGSAST